MNCQLCQMESDAYRRGRLSQGMKIQVEDHLRTCVECTEIYRLETLADRVIDQEKETLPDPFLATRVMARIENAEAAGTGTSVVINRVLKPALVTFSMAAAIFLGVLIGNIYKPADVPEAIPLELALIDDAAIESIDILSIE